MKIYDEKKDIASATQNKHVAKRLKAGIKATIKDKRKVLKVLFYLAFIGIAWFLRSWIIPPHINEGVAMIQDMLWGLFLTLCALSGTAGLLIFFGTPAGSRKITNGLMKSGLTNAAGEPPILIAAYPDETNSKLTILKFEANGISREKFEEKIAEAQAACNIVIADIMDDDDIRYFLVRCVTGNKKLPKMLKWDIQYLNTCPSVIVLGKSLIGRVTIDFSTAPHVLIGGETGSGKSILLKLILMQCVHQGAKVYISDFKGGVDFPRVWHRRCEIITDEDTLLERLTAVVNELGHRKDLLARVDWNDIDEYNQHEIRPLQRIIVACDEVAELMDKTGMGKAQKERLADIEDKINTIARLGRAFGIHLVLATQRPDAHVLNGQIKSNMVCRICGHADSILSQIVLDNADANKRISAKEKGRFLLKDGTLFQGYYFNAKDW